MSRQAMRRVGGTQERSGKPSARVDWADLAAVAIAMRFEHRELAGCRLRTWLLAGPTKAEAEVAKELRRAYKSGKSSGHRYGYDLGYKDGLMEGIPNDGWVPPYSVRELEL